MFDDPWCSHTAHAKDIPALCQQLREELESNGWVHTTFPAPAAFQTLTGVLGKHLTSWKHRIANGIDETT